MRSTSLLLALTLLACQDELASPNQDASALDAGRERHSSRIDFGAREGGASDQGAAPDGAGDLALKLDAKKPDAAKTDAPKTDAAKTDAPKPDAAKADAPKPDLLKPDLPPLKPDLPPNPTGLKVPCKQGPGWTLFRFHYSSNSSSPSIDVWDATCSYSYAPGSACNVYAVYPGFGSVSYTSQGYPILTTSEYLRVRFSVSGLSFSQATVYLQARSYATSSSTYYRVWSPIYGDATGGPVDNDWVYDWYSLDWSSYLDPSDAPALTAIQIYAYQGSGQLAVEAVELCVQ